MFSSVRERNKTGILRTQRNFTHLLNIFFRRTFIDIHKLHIYRCLALEIGSKPKVSF